MRLKVRRSTLQGPLRCGGPLRLPWRPDSNGLSRGQPSSGPERILSCTSSTLGHGPRHPPARVRQGVNATHREAGLSATRQAVPHGRGRGNGSGAPSATPHHPAHPSAALSPSPAPPASPTQQAHSSLVPRCSERTGPGSERETRPRDDRAWRATLKAQGAKGPKGLAFLKGAAPTSPRERLGLLFVLPDAVGRRKTQWSRRWLQA